MKRQLIETDTFVPERAVDLHDGARDTLERVNALFCKVDDLVLKKKRIDLAINSEPQIKQKVLRIFLRHEFYANPDDDSKSYFLFNIEGLLLDGTKTGEAPLGSFFERISIQTQFARKNHQGLSTLEWKEEDFSVGVNAHTFSTKIYADKSTAVRLIFHRTNEVCARYNISDQLRSFLPYLRVDPTEEEALLAMWQYLEANALIGNEKDKRFIRLSEGLRELFFGTQDYPSPNILISGLRSKLLPHLALARPLSVEYPLNTINTPELFALSMKNNYSLSGGGRWPTSIAYARVGGRVFDLEVDVRDSACFEVLDRINSCTTKEFACNDRIALHMERLALLARRMQDLERERVELTTAVSSFDEAVRRSTGASFPATTIASTTTTAPADGTGPLKSLSEVLLPIYERIQRRQLTERVSVAVHTAERSAIQASATVLAERMAAQASLQPTQALQQLEAKTQAEVKLEADSGSAAASTKRASTEGVTGRGKAKEVPSLRATSLHTLTGYLDVGDDALFRNDKAWVFPACEKLVVAAPPAPTASRVLESVAVKTESKQ